MTAVLFDAGGVLLRLDYAAIARRAGELGFALDDEALARAEAHARRAIDARAARHGAVPGTDATRVPDYFDDLLAAAGVPEAARPPLVGRLRADNREAGLWRVPCEGAHETLAALRGAGLRTGVVSNADGRARLAQEVAELEAKAVADIAGAEGRVGDELRAEIASLSAAAVDHVVSGSLDDATHQELIESFIKTVGASA